MNLRIKFDDGVNLRKLKREVGCVLNTIADTEIAIVSRSYQKMTQAYDSTTKLQSQISTRDSNRKRFTS